MSTDTKSEPEEKPASQAENSESELRKNLRDRLLLPVGIPLVVAAVVALLGISFSRVFLAGANKGAEHGVAEAVDEASKSSAPVIWATIITLIILFGAAGISMMKSMRTTSFALLVAGGIVLVIVAGSVLAGAGDVSTEAVDFGKPTPEEVATSTVEVDALPSLKFQSKEFSATPGVVKIDYIGKGGAHTLKIKDARYNWFLLTVNGGSTESGDVKLDPGSYYIFCTIPGHEAAGMFADLVVK